MKITLNISSSIAQGLKQPVLSYNQWTHRSADGFLTDSRFEIELSDFPIFWRQFLENLPSLKKTLKPICLDALRNYSEDKAGPSLQKALETLD